METTAAPPARGRMRSLALNLTLLAVSLMFCLGMVEAVLRVFDPLPSRVRGNTLRLNTNIKTTFHNTGIPRMDPEIRVSRNSIGFRGPEMPTDYEKRLSLFTVGGSTTECYYISDGKTWPDLLSKKLAGTMPDLWLNNAGLDGHSTFGHAHLMEQILIPLKPKAVLFLVGINDVGAEAINHRDSQTFGDCAGCPLLRRAFNFVTQNSATASAALNIQRARRAQKLGLTHRSLDLGDRPTAAKLPSPEETAALKTRHTAALEGYKQRVERLVELCQSNGIVPILVTQPALFGSGKEPVTGVQLDNIIANDAGQDARTAWTVLEWYNDVVRQAGQKQGVTLIDLARELPKSFDYYYDFIHFTNKGADAVSDILARELSPKLQAVVK